MLLWRGPFRVVKVLAANFYKLRDITQDVDLVEYREELWRTECADDAEALEYAPKDYSEITLLEVVSHVGNPEQPSTAIFTCRCQGSDEPVKFAFRACKHVGVVQEYIKKTQELKPLTGGVHNAKFRKRKKTQKLTDILKGYK